ncbi:IspD/TarI family cytidylyltransferase [Paramicrobacterium fandaimingii]|uniref:IspD/TarI family cytidylyltransferase n=1 Tax=Paramicrobacterium fandaimingii TaxID=2708079 RepID=UPI00141DC588|nr:IspD/TarI family cytidylyltransferase [Microbacterium fandaimingii]
MRKNFKVSAIVNCAGKGIRFGSNKLLVDVGNLTVLEKTVRCFLLDFIDEVIVTVSAENHDIYRRILIDDAGLDVRLVIGAEERHLSAMNGLNATSGDFIVVHDGVRPFTTPDLVTSVLDAAIENDAAMLGLPSTVQVKLVNDEEFITGSLERSHSWLGQTPQAFKRELLETAYEKAIADKYSLVSDDADLVAEYCGTSVKIIFGNVDNIKITTPQDLELARLIDVERTNTSSRAPY